MNNPITVTVSIYADINIIWEAFNTPEHIKNWNALSDDWYCSKSQSIFKEGWMFNHTMASKDGNMRFDFEWTYTKIVDKELVCYTLDNGRKVAVYFQDEERLRSIRVDFEPGNENNTEAQKKWWEAILNNFAEYCESLD